MMSTKYMIWFLPIVFRTIGSSSCLPPVASAEKLKAHLSYLNGMGSNMPYVERFTSATIGKRSYIRQDIRPASNYAPRQRPVYIYEGSRSLGQINCPAGEAWIACLLDWELSRHNDNSPSKDEHQQLEGLRVLSPSRVCEFRLEVQRWQPSPDNQMKRTTAVEVLAEIRMFIVEGVRSIVIRDFNIDDPEINIYFVNLRGEDQVLGCHFDDRRSPHCSWHMFGQSPVESIIGDILKMPYRLYPIMESIGN